jgi:hypothetical protein
VIQQQWQDRADWVAASTQTYEAIVDEVTRHGIAALIAANSRTKAMTLAKRRSHIGVRRAQPAR